MATPRPSLLVLTVFALAALAPLRSAHAEPPADDVLTPLDAREVRRDVRVASYDEPGDAAPLWVSIAGGLASTRAGAEGMGILSFGGTLERLASRRVAPARAKEIDPDKGKPRDPPKPSSDRATDRERAAAARGASTIARADNDGTAIDEPRIDPRVSAHDDEPPPIEPRIDGAFARGLVRAVRARAHERETDERLDGLATRARASALLPELRVRVARVTSGTQALSPTEWDPARVTSSDGTGLWLEGRATFRLDRLVFADDEIAIERIRTERDRMDRALVADALAELALYQRGAARASDPTLADDDRVTGEITQLSAEAALDVLSDGWFSAHLPKASR